MTRLASSRWLAPALLLAASALLLGFDFGSRVFGTNDDARFPMLARDILAGGHWWLPSVNGAPHLNKPPLFAWLIALPAWLGGAVTQRTAAVPSLLAGLGVVLLTYAIGCRLLGRGAAVVAGLVVVTTYGVFSMARVPMPDMAMCFFMTAAMAAFVRAEFAGRATALVVFYLMLAVGFWSKGPAALLVLIVAVVYVAWVDGARGLARLRLVPGLLGLFVLILPWWLLGRAAGHAQFTGDILTNDWLLWYLPLGHRRASAWLDPIVQPLTVLLPWSPLVPVAVVAALRPRGPDERRATRLLLVWAAVVFGLIAIAEEQRMRYYLPLAPPVALLIGAAWSRLGLRRPGRVFAVACGVAAVALAVFQVYAGPRHNAGTDLAVVAREARDASKRLYTVKVPELVLTFYLDRPVTLLPDYARFEALRRQDPDGYLVIADRLLPAGGPSGMRRLGGGRVNGRPFSLFGPAG